jgi:DNA-binding beta-propeller fold protein YncE
MRAFLPVSLRRGAILATLVLVFGLPLTATAQQPAPREPVPDRAAQMRSEERIRGLYRDDYEKARADASAGAALAAKLLRAAQDGKGDPADRFVELREARDLAARAADTTAAFHAAEEMARQFAVGVLYMKADALAAAIAAATTPDAARSFAEQALALTQEAVDADQFDPAGRLGKVAADAAARAQDQALVETVAGRNRALVAMRQAFAAIGPVVERLNRDPEDAAANLAMGKYLALVKGNWERALFYLAQGNDPTMRRLAQRDLARPEDKTEGLQLADAWWNLAEQEKGEAQLHLRQRAVSWYEQVLEQTRGFQRGRLEQRIASVPRPFTATVGWDYTGRPGEIRTLTGHTSTVYGVAFAPDGKRVVSGSVDGRAALWDTVTGRQLHILQGHGGMIWSVAYDPRGKYVYTSSWDGTVKMWDAARGVEAKRFPTQGRIADINGMAISPSGKQMLTGSDDGAVRLWDLDAGQEVRQFHGHRGFVYGVAFSPDGKRALSGGSNDNQMILWDLQAGKELRRFAGLPGQIRTVAFSADGRKAVNAGGTDVSLWDVQTGQLLRQFRGHTGMVYAVALSPDGRRLATGGADRTVRLWDVASGRELHRFDGHTSGVFSVAFSPGGGRLVSGGQDNTVRLWGLPR